MNQPSKEIPSTRYLVKRLRRPVEKTTFDKIERCVLAGIGALIVVALSLKGLIAFEVIPPSWRPRIGVLVMLATYLLGAAWFFNQVVYAIVSIRRGMDGLAQSTDDTMAHESRFICELAIYDAAQLKLRSSLLDISAKRLTRHTTRVGLLAAAGAIVINLYHAGQSGSWWPRLDALSLFIYAGSIGIAIASIGMIGFVSSIERLSKLLSLAAEEGEARHDTQRSDRLPLGGPCEGGQG